MPVTRSASANVLYAHAADTASMKLATPKSKGPSKKKMATKRSSLIENPSVGNRSVPRISPVLERRPGSKSGPGEVDAMMSNGPLEQGDYDQDYGSDDSFEKSIVWSAKKAKSSAQGAVPINSLPLAPKTNEAKITYSPVLASILAKGLDSADLEPVFMSDKPGHAALDHVCSQSERPGTKISLVQSAQNGAIGQSEAIDSTTIKDVKKLKPSPPNLSKLSNITKQLRQQHRADNRTRPPQETVPETKLMLTSASLTRKPSSRSPRRPTTTVPFSFATDARERNRRKASASHTQSFLGVDSDSIVSSSAPTRPTLQKKRSALLEREKVVKKSLSNLSLRSQYSGKIDMHDYTNKPQPSSRNISAPVMSAPLENDSISPGSKLGTNAANKVNDGKSVRKSLFTSLSFYRSKSDLKYTSMDNSTANGRRETVSVTPFYPTAVKHESSTAVQPTINFPAEYTSADNPLEGGMQALNLEQASQAEVERHHQMAGVDKLRETAAEQGRRTVELWAARQQGRSMAS
ncbi:hypothetical protein V1525DRAFT_449958 [Lipomyces kononenkoae]|uniref:Uncharacterized protein n=1 Tax=Lipomyces kononenkoae TaxID=34357 RepID=A0ACC3T315_LIPKO